MRVLRLTLIIFKRMLRDWGNLLSMLVMPLVLIIGVGLFSDKNALNLDTNVAFNIQDKGNYSVEILKELGITKNIFFNNDKKAMELLEKNDVVAVYFLPENFTDSIKKGEKPAIKTYKRENGTAALPVEINLNNSINKLMKEQLFLNSGVIRNVNELYSKNLNTNIIKKENTLDKKAFATILLLIYFIILSSNTIGTELLNLKNNKVLTRSMTTSNDPYKIIGSLFLAMFLLQLIVYSLVLLISKLILGFTINNIHVIIINIILSILFSISLGLFITRIFKSPATSTYVLTIFCAGTFFLGALSISGDSVRKIPWLLANLAKFTPQYWILDSIYNSTLFPNVFALLLMVLALFTAGNFKVNDFANKI